MNRIYRLVWSTRIGAFVAVSELVKSHGKRASSLKGALPAAVMLGFSAPAWAAPPGNHNSATALPTAGVVTSGQATIATSSSAGADHMTVDQTSQSAIINWQTFDIGQNDSVQFIQPNSRSVALNRVLGQNPSDILGNLSANGQVFLVNPSGILFGRGASVNVDGLVASTLNISDADFLAGNLQFSSGARSHASIQNQGSISANMGYVAMLGANVSNTGVITARLGTVVLASGNAMTLDLAGDGLLNVTIDRGAVHGEVENGGIIKADGGQVILTAQAAGNLLSTAVNNTGVIQAQTVDNHDGTIRLLGDMQSGTVNVAGTLDASAPQGGNGGAIETSAAHVEVAPDAHITTTAIGHGLTGSWLIDPQDFTVGPTGDISGPTLSGELNGSNILIQSSSGAAAGSGNININDTVNWSANTLTLTAANNININAIMNASGAASLTMNPATTNGADSAVAGGTVNMGLGSSGFYGQVNFSGTGTLTISGQVFTVINNLGTATSSNDGTLQGIQGNLNGNYALGSNIDASATSTWNSNAGFTALGNGTNNFNGIFDGLGHTISGLTIDVPSQDYAGLFGAINGRYVTSVS
jgi:filamentous hemagglutinin family protein